MNDPWDDILADDEEILWQGRPSPLFAMSRADFIPMIFGLTFSAFALLWMSFAAIGGALMWLAGLPHFAVGMALALYAICRDTVARRYSYYTLTNQRAIIGLFYPWRGRSLRKFRITKNTKISTDHEHTVVFGRAGRSKRHPFPTRAPQFSRIDDAEKVYHLMRQIQKEKS
ncbi:hypothetical protein [Sulfitobacter donghicola]|uniref:Aspartate carbamoyltransferase catalytic subunit n=1 Tax=Sulfitobacter donghicola DSW-25 = KCTC 12864 = JCM 14565 TaxID=1300350 RepID=A0A073ITM3_9RHOB|nr:hypothetical protein [Sulfitobacter donghicola]KEJ88757.1 aspartate carbamoyltransferase catalytic subunit [Sulfitobacter donghicola DSW-25 = KCTC 12864 = JCM 14565]KIN68545.1 Aspartate carbamoyltransferase catalytic subunit [Sulfitobacter donghicola DSW-25 = KCTC 12864 = JCM 14565]